MRQSLIETSGANQAVRLPEIPLFKVFEDFQGTFFKKFLEWSVRKSLTYFTVTFGCQRLRY